MKRIRVVVVDDSALCREMLGVTLGEDGDIEVVGEAADGQAAIDVVARSNAELVTLDVEMPRMGGLLAVEHIMARTPVPILMVTGRPAEQRVHIVSEAVRRGALDLVAKPQGHHPEEADTLRAVVRRLARVPVMRHLAGGRARRPSFHPVPTSLAYAGRWDAPIMGVVASAGGPAAINALVSRLAPDFEGCIAIVQHLLQGFAASFVDFLRAHTPLRVLLAFGPTRPTPGTVLVAPDDRHLVLSPAGTFVLSDSAPRGGFRPSADILFMSLAATCGPSAVGVVLSGIGNDGAAGLLAMRRAGATTIVQDEATSVVFGMPRAAQENGAATHVLPLEEIPAALTRCAKRLSSRTPRPPHA
jgi:two-component system chemotaxis response regulator CheB